MRKPRKAPTTDQLFQEIDSERIGLLLRHFRSPTVDGKYLHWDKLRHHDPPPGISHQEWWFALKLSRQSLAREIPLTDHYGRPFAFVLADPIPERLHQLDLGTGGLIEVPEGMQQITNPETRDRYYVRSLIEEAITSSQLEGAATTRLIAKEMIRTGRKPRDRSERMILNNYRTMQRIGELKEEPLSTELVFEIHKIVTDHVLDDPSAVGRFRHGDETVVVDDMYGEILHEPPPAAQLEERMSRMCGFANGETPEEFINPVIRSILLHFWLSYDHPFVDGNGRTARALFYWSMLRYKYWLFEFISISQIIRKGPVKYGRAFLYTETDENDLTYFVLYHLDVMHRALAELHKYLKKKTSALRQLEAELRGVVVLNHRQRALVGHALHHPQQIYTIESHRLSHNIVYQTARSDLLDLAERGLLEARKVGKSWRFTPSHDMEKKLRKLS
ncbi:MAG: Fic family protein [Pirellulales bacterium]|nr:Fic family protein [Pirellulales bacterium]